jgi:hypothetical protein
LRNHDDTVAKLPGGFALGGFRDNGLSAIGLPDRTTGHSGQVSARA